MVHNSASINFFPRFSLLIISGRSRNLTHGADGEIYGFTCWALTAAVFVGSVATVLLAVTEESALDAVSVAASQEAVLAEWLVRHQQRLHLSLLVLELAVLNSLFPVAGLLLDVEEESGGTTDGLETLNQREKEKVFIRRELEVSWLNKLTEVVHWITSRHESPSLATNLNHSPASLSLHSSCSKVSSFFLSDLSSCRLTRIAFAVWKKNAESRNENGKAIKAEIIGESTSGKEWKKVSAEWKDFFSALDRLLVQPSALLRFITTPIHFFLDFFFPNASHFFLCVICQIQKSKLEISQKEKSEPMVLTIRRLSPQNVPKVLLISSSLRRPASAFFNAKTKRLIIQYFTVSEARKIIG
jgi:hypothetical protein